MCVYREMYLNIVSILVSLYASCSSGRRYAFSFCFDFSRIIAADVVMQANDSKGKYCAGHVVVVDPVVILCRA